MKLIDKSAIVAEIERIKKEECPTDSYEGRCKLLWFEQFLSFLDTLEVKKVDLEKEANEAWDYIFSHGWDENSRMALKHDEYMAFAKHFYELGLKAQKGE